MLTIQTTKSIIIISEQSYYNNYATYKNKPNYKSNPDYLYQMTQLTQ